MQKKRTNLSIAICIAAVFALFSVLSFASASDSNLTQSYFGDKLNKIGHYAEEYDIGNINYAQMMIYISAERQDMENIIGMWDYSPEKLTSAFGEPTRSSKSLYSKKDGKMIKWDTKVGVWEKIIYDGKKISINLKVEPFLYYDEEQKKESLITGFGIYQTFKPSVSVTNLNTDSLISELKSLSDEYSQSQSKETSENILSKSRELENSVQPYIEQTESCIKILDKVLGTDGKVQEKIMHTEAILYEGDEFSVIAQMETCESCKDNSWLSMNAYKQSIDGGWMDSKQDKGEEFSEVPQSQIKSKITQTFNDFKAAKSDDEASRLQSRLSSLMEAWQKSSNQDYKKELMEKSKDSQPDSKESMDELLRKHEIESIQEKTVFYQEALKSFKETQYKFTRTSYQKKIASHFISPENCENNMDDNQNGETDCEDKSCEGQRCGTVDGVEAFCYSKTCQPRQDQSIQNTEESKCQRFLAEKCEGMLIFKGKDSLGCPLEPICIQKNKNCTLDSDCSNARCGTTSCVEGTCKTTDLSECKKEECSDGNKKTVNCESGDGLVTDVCIEGTWESTGQACSLSSSQNTQEPNAGCSSKGDCSTDEVCSNGQCIALPQSNEETSPQSTEPSQQEPQASPNLEESNPSSSSSNDDTSGENSGLTGSVIKSLKSITGFVINGFSTQEEEKNNTEQKEEDIKEEKNNQKDQNGDLFIYGECRTTPTGMQGSIKVQGWGFYSNIFDDFQKDKEDMSKKCFANYQSIVMERKELEKSLNNEFAKWFFEEYLANSAEQWNTRSGTLDDLYWADINLVQSLAANKDCIGNDSTEFNLINYSYTSAYGGIHFWEEIKQVNLDKIGDSWSGEKPKSGKVDIITPYQNLWIFPSKDFIKAQLKAAMQEQTFNTNHYPDSNDTIDPKTKEQIKKNEAIMSRVNALIDKYGKDGHLKIKILLNDYAANETVLGIFAELSSDNVLEVKPMFPADMPQADVTSDVDFNKLMGIIEAIQKDTREFEVRSPEWASSFSPVSKVKQIETIIGIWFKVRSFINSVQTTPESARNDVVKSVNSFLWDMATGKGNVNPQEDSAPQSQTLNSQDTNSLLSGEVVYTPGH